MRLAWTCSHRLGEPRSLQRCAQRTALGTSLPSHPPSPQDSPATLAATCPLGRALAVVGVDAVHAGAPIPAVVPRTVVDVLLAVLTRESCMKETAEVPPTSSLHPVPLPQRGTAPKPRRAPCTEAGARELPSRRPPRCSRLLISRQTARQALSTLPPLKPAARFHLQPRPASSGAAFRHAHYPVREHSPGPGKRLHPLRGADGRPWRPRLRGCSPRAAGAPLGMPAPPTPRRAGMNRGCSHHRSRQPELNQPVLISYLKSLISSASPRGEFFASKSLWQRDPRPRVLCSSHPALLAAARPLRFVLSPPSDSAQPLTSPHVQQERNSWELIRSAEPPCPPWTIAHPCSRVRTIAGPCSRDPQLQPRYRSSSSSDL